MNIKSALRRLIGFRREPTKDEEYKALVDSLLEERGITNERVSVEPLRFNSRPIKFEVDMSKCIWR